MKKNKNNNSNELIKEFSNEELASNNLVIEKDSKKSQKVEKKAQKQKNKKAPETIENKSQKSLEKKNNQNDEINFDELKNYGSVLGLSQEKIDEINKKVDHKAFEKNTELVLNVKFYNKFIDYLPSDFTSKMVKKIFIQTSRMNLPKNTKLKVSLTPNDTEKTLKVIVTVDKYYKTGVVVEQTKVFEPFWIVGFGTYSLIVTIEPPIESSYRITNMHSFAFAQSQKMRNKKISPKFTNRSKSNFEVEQDFIRARNNKNWYLQHYIDNLNKMKNIEWECVPKININWTSNIIKIDLYLKIDTIKLEYRKTKNVYVDSFNVKANDVLTISSTTKIVDIDSIMYLIALNAIYKNIKVFSYKTLYSTYKLICAEILGRGFRLKPISPNNLETLKIVDFSKHFWCKNMFFNDAILHIMNLMSSQEDYYRMKYAYTLQKDPTLLFSDFIVKEFKEVKTNELATIVKNQENKYWNEKLKQIEDANYDETIKDKDFYINNYNVLDLTNNTYHDVESYLMGVIKGEKDEITRISKLGEELLRIDEDPRFTKKESNELRKVAKKLDQNYKELFEGVSAKELKKATNVKPLKLDEPRTKKAKKHKHKNNEKIDVNNQNDNMIQEGVNNG